MGGLTERVEIMSCCMKVSTFHDTDQGPSVAFTHNLAED